MEPILLRTRLYELLAFVHPLLKFLIFVALFTMDGVGMQGEPDHHHGVPRRSGRGLLRSHGPGVGFLEVSGGVWLHRREMESRFGPQVVWQSVRFGTLKSLDNFGLCDG